MRLSSLLYRRAREPQNVHKVPFKELLPLKLKDFVSSKNQKILERGCLYEVSLLLTCLEENNYENQSCLPLIKALDNCYDKYSKNQRRQRTEQEQVVPVPNSKNFTHKQIGYMLRRYPNV